MKLRTLRKLACLLAVAQLLLAAPLATAYAEMFSDASATDCCPCCPEGVQGTAACLSACSASVGAIVSVVLDASPPAAAPVAFSQPTQRADLSDPPLKPPPI